MRQLKITQKITSRETESLDKYLSEVAKVNLITAEEEVILAKAIKAGDTVALQKMVNANLRFVVSVAKQYQNHGMSLNDLINEGNLGLIKAASRFDETRGFKFISYAVWWIRQSILQALAEHTRIVRLPLNRVGALSKVNRAFSELEQKYQREPTADEVGDELEMSPEVVDQLKAHGKKQLSIDAPLTSESEAGSLYDILPNELTEEPDADLMRNSMRGEIKRVLATLSGREADVISLFYGLSGGHTMGLGEIGERYNLTCERVRQIKEKAVKKLRHSSRARVLANYL